jgi:hypothetical protein
VSDPYDEEVRRLAKVITTLAELADRSVAALAESSGLQAAEIQAIFDGTEKLEVAHVLRLAEALRVHPAELFLLAFPRRTPPRGHVRELLEKMREALGLRNPETNGSDGL